MNRTIARGLLLDAFSQVMDNKVFRLLVLVSITLIAPAFLIGFREDGIHLLFGWKFFSYEQLFEAFHAPVPHVKDLHVVVIQNLQEVIVRGFAGSLGILFCLGDVDALPLQDRERLLRDVVAQLDELTVLVTDLVDLARGDEPAAITQDVRLDLLVEEAVERARRHASDKSFVTDLEPSLVVGVPGRLDRAVSNLLDNAAKWSPEGGEIDVSVHDGEVTVRDHGPGIDESDLPFVFDRFYRAPTARGLPGSGLGLAIVRQVATSHGGEVVAERAEGGGTTMRLRVPAVRMSSPDGAEIRAREPV